MSTLSSPVSPAHHRHAGFASRGLALVLVGLGLAGCSTTLDMDAIGKSVSEGLKGQLDMAIASVTCPAESRAAKAGDVFECIATPAAGGRLVVTVTQKDDQGNINWEVTKTEGLLDLRVVETSVKEGLRSQANVDATVECGERWKAIKVGEVFECQAKAADGQTATVAVTQDDAEGNISWAVR